MESNGFDSHPVEVVLVHPGTSGLGRLLTHRRHRGRESQMPYLKPFPLPEESDLRRFGGEAQTVVHSCTRTVLGVSL